MEGHKRDAFALVEFLAQLEDEVEVSGVQTWDEISAASRYVICIRIIVQGDSSGRAPWVGLS